MGRPQTRKCLKLNNNNRGNNRRRGRTNNGRPQNGGQQLNRIDSRARGNAPQMLEKYRKLASDAHLNGDRVQAEYYLQFADHYFRVIADSRVRTEDQRTRPLGPNGERWQEQDGEEESNEFSAEGDYAAYERAPSRQEREPREERPRDDRPRDDREERPRQDRQRDDRPRDDRPRGDRQRDDRPREDRPRQDRQRDDRPRDEWQPREERAPREDRGPREDRPRENRRFDRSRERDAEPQVAEVAALPGEGVPASEGEAVIDANDNPFVRDTRPTRGLRPRTERRPRVERERDDAPAALDPSSLPPSISVRSEPEPVAPVAAEPAPAAAADEAAPAPKKRGRPRKNPLPVEG